MSERVNFFRYIGGKHYMLNHILELLDYSKYCYIELFGGSGKVLLNKQPHKVEIYNDYNKDLYNLFKVVRDNYKEFIDKLENIPYCEEVFKEFRVSNPVNDVDKAIKTFYLFNCSFGGNGRSFGFSYDKNEAGVYSNKVKNLGLIKERLKNVTILNKDFKRILKSIENKDNIMLYADPPYYDAEHYYTTTFSKQDHHILAEYLNKAKYSVMLSYYYFDGIEDLYPKGKWYYYSFGKVKHSYGVKEGGARPRSTELLLLNYEIPSAK